MELHEVVRRRRMVRNYAPTPLDPAIVDRMLEHAVRAPSAGFSQGWSFLRLDTPADVERFWQATTPEGTDPGNRWITGMRRAPVVLVPLVSRDAYLDRYAEPDKGWTDRDEARWPVPYWYVDGGMATLLILQTAVEQGVGACFFGISADRRDAFREAFGVPDAWEALGAVTVGHRADDPGSRGSSTRRPRRDVDDVVHRGRWGG